MPPQNILQTKISEDAVAAALQSRPLPLPVFGALEWRQAARNPQAQALFAPLLALAKQERDTPLPVLTDELYADYHRTGSREAFSKAYFRRRRMLSRAAICALLEGPQEQSGWAGILAHHLRDIMREESWALTAHVGSPTGKDPRVLELFAAETANTLGEILATFEAVLPEDLNTAIRSRLRTGIFQNYLDNHERCGWTKETHNWNAVCHQGILGAALAAEQDTQIVARLLLTASQYLPNFLAGFGIDGGCSEGPGYWGYGFGWFTFLNEQLETASQGALSVMEGDVHVRQIALFYPRAAFSNGYMANFSDNGPQGYPNPRLLSYLGERLHDDLLRADGDAAWRALFQSGLNLETAERCDFFYLARLLRDCPSTVPDTVPLTRSDFFFRDLQVLTAHRTDAGGNLWEFAVKGGHNDEHHNHNDCGSYLLNINGRPIATEIGAPQYYKGYFGPDRYEAFAARSLGHSLPVVNGCEQSSGPAFAAVVLQHELSTNDVRFVVDLTACYPPEAACRRLVRTLAFDAAAGTLTVTDDYHLSEVRSFETAIITNWPKQETAQGLLIVSGTQQVLLQAAPYVQITEIQESRVKVAPTSNDSDTVTVRRIALRPAALTAQGTVSYSFSVPEASTSSNSM